MILPFSSICWTEEMSCQMNTSRKLSTLPVRDDSQIQYKAEAIFYIIKSKWRWHMIYDKPLSVHSHGNGMLMSSKTNEEQLWSLQSGKLEVRNWHASCQNYTIYLEKVWWHSIHVYPGWYQRSNSIYFYSRLQFYSQKLNRSFKHYRT
jgi:hypothetical protein